MHSENWSESEMLASHAWLHEGETWILLFTTVWHSSLSHGFMKAWKRKDERKTFDKRHRKPHTSPKSVLMEAQAGHTERPKRRGEAKNPKRSSRIPPARLSKKLEAEVVLASPDEGYNSERDAWS